MGNHYETLGVKPDASESDIKKAYIKLMMQWHPDKNPNNLVEAEKRFKKIVAAKEILADADKRRIYDQQLAHNLDAGANNPLNASHQKFELAELQRAIRNFSSNGVIEEVINTRPSWTKSNPSPLHSQALIPMDTTALTLGERGGRYAYTQNPADENSGKATLDLTQPIATIDLDLSKDQDIRAGVQLAAAAKWSGILVSENLPLETRTKIKENCSKYGLYFDLIPTPKLTTKATKPLEIEDKPRTAPESRPALA